MKKKKTSLISKLFGFETIKQGAVMTKSMISDISPSKKHLIKESFARAITRNGITKSEENTRLLSLYKNQKIQFMIIIGGVIFMSYNSVTKWLEYDESLSNLLSAISFTTLSLALSSISLHYAFRCFQIRNKRLGMLKLWLTTPKEWYPFKIKIEKLEKVDNYQAVEKDHLTLSDEVYIKALKEL